MKRVGNLYPALISDENIERAIIEVNKGHRRSFGHLNKTVLWVEANKEKCIKILRNIVEQGFVPGPTRNFYRYDENANKTREIHEPKLWPDQYIHHMLIQVLQPVMMRGMDYWCCGSIPGRGIQHGKKGIERWMAQDANYKRYKKHRPKSKKKFPNTTHYCAELDIYHFYDSLKPEVVMERMRQLIKDEKVLDLIERTVKDGILIGAYPSQWFANTVLQPLDHMIREKLHVKHYVRYMDNLTIFGSNKKDLRAAVQEISKWLQSRGLQLKKSWCLYNTIQSNKQRKKWQGLHGKAYYRKHPRLVNAMGYMFGHGYTLMRKKNLFRLKRKLAKIYKKLDNKRTISFREAAGILSRLGMLKHCCSRYIRETYVRKGFIKKMKKIVSEESKRRYQLEQAGKEVR